MQKNILNKLMWGGTAISVVLAALCFVFAIIPHIFLCCKPTGGLFLCGNVLTVGVFSAIIINWNVMIYPFTWRKQI